MVPQSSIHGFLHICIIKECRKESYALRLYIYMKSFGLQSHGLLAKHLVQSLVNAKDTPKIQKLFDTLECNNSLSFNSRIHGHVKFGNLVKALDLYKRMCVWEEVQIDGGSVRPSGQAMVNLLRACGRLNDISFGMTLHRDILRMKHLQRNVFVGSAVLTMYAKFGMFDECEESFGSTMMTMLRQDVVGWTTMIDAYITSACSNIGNEDKGKCIHVEVESSGLLNTYINVGNALINMYCECGSISMLELVFEELPLRDVISWTTLISSCSCNSSNAEKALRYLDQMQLEGINPDAITFVFCLKACGNIGDRNKGQQIHVEVERRGILEKDAHVGSVIVEMYAKLGLLDRAQDVFNILQVRDTITWNHLIVGYNECGFDEEALNCFQQMQVEGVPPDSVSYNFTLKACGNLGDLAKGREIHAEVEEKELLLENHAISTGLVEMYGKCGLHKESEELFNQLHNRDVVSWNSLLTAYLDYDCGEDALNCFARMKLDGVLPNAITYICALKACTIIGAIDKGQNIHAEIERCGLSRICLVGNALVNMYAQCNCIAVACQVFRKLQVQDVASWTAMMTGYAKLGDSEMVFRIFNEMLAKCIQPNVITFIIVLNACSRRGLSSASQTYFEAMSKQFGIIPMLQHHGCMIDLFGRIGELEKVTKSIENMPASPNLVMWQTVLDASQKWGNLMFGGWAFEHALCLDGSYAGS